MTVVASSIDNDNSTESIDVLTDTMETKGCIDIRKPSIYG